MGNTLGSHLETYFSYLETRVCCLGRVLVLINFRNGFPANLVIKRGSYEFSQPLDYLGVPFRCYRCHVFGHLMNECSLPFNKKSYVSVRKTWRVKNRGLKVDDMEGLDEEGLGLQKEVLASDVDSEDLNLIPKPLDDIFLASQSSLLSLKPLSIISLSDPQCLGRNQTDIESVVSDQNYVQSEGLRDLGFVSPPKIYHVASKGYFCAHVRNLIKKV